MEESTLNNSVLKELIRVTFKSIDRSIRISNWFAIIYVVFGSVAFSASFVIINIVFGSVLLSTSHYITDIYTYTGISN